MKKLINRRNIILSAVFVLCAALILAGLIIYNDLSGSLITQRAANEFRGESELLFGQVSAFFKAGEGAAAADIYAFREKLDGEYVAASLEAPPRGSLYKDGYSAEAKITVQGERTSAELTVLGVGGDWFYFHQMKLRSGSYIRETDLVHDGVVLDEEAAWRLFGGFDLVGMTVTIDDVPYVVVGVVEREKDGATNAAYSGGAGMFMHYDTMNARSETKITEYEIVGADPIDGFLKNIVAENFSSAVTVENSGRFRPMKIYGLLGDFGKRSMRTEAVAFPYWENAARYIEDWLQLILLVMTALAVYPAVMLMIVFVKLIKLLILRLKTGLPELAEGVSERRYERRKRG